MKIEECPICGGETEIMGNLLICKSCAYQIHKKDKEKHNHISRVVRLASKWGWD